MVLGERRKKKFAPLQIDYVVHIQMIRPWPPSESLRSVEFVLLQWENGDRNSGFVTSTVEDDFLEFNKSFTLFLTLRRGKKSREKFKKNCLEFHLYESPRENASQGQLLGTASINFADYGVIRDGLAISVPMNCKKSSKGLLQPSLYVKVQPVDKDRQEPGFEMVNDEIEYESDIASYTDDNSSHSSSTFASSIFEAAWASSPSQIEKVLFLVLDVFGVKMQNDFYGEIAVGKSKSEENTQQHKEKYIDRLISKITSSQMPNQGGKEFEPSNSGFSQDFQGSKVKQNEAIDASDTHLGSKELLLEDTRQYSQNKVIGNGMRRQGTMNSIKNAIGAQMNKDRLKSVRSVQIRGSATLSELFSDSKIMKEVRNDVAVDASAYARNAARIEKKEMKSELHPSIASIEKGVPDAELPNGKPEWESKIKMLEEELKEAAAIEIGLYSVVAEHGSYVNKLHAPARRIARFYLHAWREGSQAKQASAARAAVSGLALVSRACGNDVPRSNPILQFIWLSKISFVVYRLTFWLSNCIVLRAIISQATGNDGSNGGSTWDKKYKQRMVKPSATEGMKNNLIKNTDDWEDIDSFIKALEKIEAWIFSKVIKSVWWQCLTPHMQTAVVKANRTRGSTVKRTYGSKHALADQEQGNNSIKIWRKAFKDACERICPIRAGGHNCGCLPMLSKLAMKHLVNRLDVAMFNAILRRSAEDMPTDPAFDPISDPNILPIPIGQSSFRAGAQLKNAVGNWSRWLTDLIGIEDDDSSADNNVIGDSFRAFRLLNALSNLMMLPFEMLVDETTRNEFCPIFGPALIKRVLSSFVPDEFRPEPIPKTVFQALDFEEHMDAASGERITKFPCTAISTSYTPPPTASLSSFLEKIGNQAPKRSGLSSLKKSYTSDVELDELDSPLTSILADCFKDSPNLMKPGRTNVVSIVPRGMSYPPILQSSDEQWGTSNGADENSRNVSRIIFCRYFSLGKSSSSIARSCPTRLSISALALSNTLGWLSRMAIAHSIVTDEVSVPPSNITLTANDQSWSFGSCHAGAHQLKIQDLSSAHKRLFYKLPELHSLLVVFIYTKVPFSRSHPQYYVKGQLRKLRFQLNCRKPMSRGLNQFLQQNLDFVLPDGLKGVETSGGEDLQRANAAEIAPVIAVGGAD
nr:Metal-response element-binding transcription factor 2 like [Ipomoea batatas]